MLKYFGSIKIITIFVLSNKSNNKLTPAEPADQNRQRKMKTITINLNSERVEINGNSCSFHEAGLYENVDGDMHNITDRNDIEQYLRDKYEDEEIEIIFIDLL